MALPERLALPAVRGLQEVGLRAPSQRPRPVGRLPSQFWLVAAAKAESSQPVAPPLTGALAVPGSVGATVVVVTGAGTNISGGGGGGGTGFYETAPTNETSANSLAVVGGGGGGGRLTLAQVAVAAASQGVNQTGSTVLTVLRAAMGHTETAGNAGALGAWAPVR